MTESMNIVGADEGTRSYLRKALSPACHALADVTIAVVRSKADWRLLNALDGDVVVLVHERSYAEGEAGGWPIFHIEDLSSVAAYLACKQTVRLQAAASESPEYAW